MDAFVAMPTCAARAEVRDLTVAQLAKVGIVPTLFQNDNPSPILNYFDNIEAIGKAFELSQRRYLLIVEDDLHISPRFKACAERAMLGELRLVTFFNPNRNGYPPEVLRAVDAGEPLPSTFYRVTNQRGWWSGLALLIRDDMVACLWRHVSREGVDSNDHVPLDIALQKTAVPMYCAVPNTVQHRKVPSATTSRTWGPRVQSITFQGEVT